MSVAPRKSLGQHFLSNPVLLARIAATTGAGSGDVVLEIGPGKGSLTKALLDRGSNVVAIERDARLIEPLRRMAQQRLVVVHADALEADWHALVAPWASLGATWHIAGNIPYNITSPLIAKAMSPPFPASITFLVQREFASRITAKPGTRDYGALTVGVQAIADVTATIKVPRSAFSPAPKVDSTVVHLVPRESPLVAPNDLASFRRMVVSIFSYRRKRIIRALREATGQDADAVQAWLDAAEIDPEVRPEQVDLAGFARLFAHMLTPEEISPS